MRTGWVDARNGLTGDMWLGAVVSAGASLEGIERAVQALGIGEVRVTYAPVRRGGRQAASVRVRPPAQTPHVATWAQVRALVEFAALDDAPRARALAVLERYARAEATTLGTTLEEITFPEVAMLDDLAAAIGTCVGLHALGVDRLVAGPVGLPSDEVGGLDATVELLLAGHTTRPLAAQADLVTPIGAALLAELAEPGDDPNLRVESEGAGAASRDQAEAGLLHLAIGQPLEPPA